MAVINLEVPDQLADQLRRAGEEVARLHGLAPAPQPPDHFAMYASVAEVLEFLARLPSPEQVLALRAAEPLQSRISALLEKNRTVGLDPKEEQELDQYEYVDHLVRIAKAKAQLKIQGG